MSTEKLQLRYLPLSAARRWDANPKKHDIDTLVQSISTHGFVDPPKHDENLDGLSFGNGRVEALERMKAAGYPPPRGITEQDGEWLVPVLVGLDAESHDAAVALAVDHNAVGLMGSSLDFVDRLAIWDEGRLQQVLADAPDAAALLASFEDDDLSSLLDAPDFQPVSADDQSRLDQKKHVTCPECGHEFRP